MRHFLSGLLSVLMIGLMFIQSASAGVAIIPHITRPSGDFVSNTIIDDTFSCQSPDGVRIQNVYLGSTLFKGEFLEMGLVLPPETQEFEPKMFPNVIISLSTTDKEPGELDPVFENNIGPDETSVFQGPFTAQFRDCGGGFPQCQFSIPITLQNTFKFDPSEGNLLVDITVPPCSPEDGLPGMVGNDDPEPVFAQSNISQDADSSTGTLQATSSRYQIDGAAPNGNTYLGQLFPSLPGENSIRAINSPESFRIALVWGFKRGTTRVTSGICKGAVFDIKNARLFSYAYTNQFGVSRRTNIFIPSVITMDIPIWMQALNPNGCFVSNLAPNVIRSLPE